MLDHVSFGTHDLKRSTLFYAQVLAPLGYGIQVQSKAEVGFGIGSDWTFFLYPAPAESTLVGARMHVAFRATSRREVIDAHAAALASGAVSVPDREPAERPQFGADYFGCVFRDLDGHTIELMTRQRTDQAKV